MNGNDLAAFASREFAGCLLVVVTVCLIAGIIAGGLIVWLTK